MYVYEVFSSGKLTTIHVYSMTYMYTNAGAYMYLYIHLCQKMKSISHCKCM